MSDIEHLISIGTIEIANHQDEARRLHDMADRLVTAAEHHLRQAESWAGYIGSLVIPERTAEVIPITRNQR